MQSQDWYYSDGVEKIGPVAERTVAELIKLGKIERATLVWRPGFSDWVEAASCSNFESFFPSSPPPTPSVIDSKRSEQNFRSNNYFLRHWRGELTLPVSWWVNGFLVTFAINIVDTFLALSSQVEFGPRFALFYLLILLAIYIWQIVGIWRSAQVYVETAQKSLPPRSGSWGRVAQVFTVLGVISYFGTFVPMFQDVISLNQIADSGENERYYIQLVADTDVLLNGVISDDSVSELIAVFESNPGRNALVLNSPGGMLVSAFLMADYIEDNDLVVAADGECISACMLLLAAADTSAASLDSNLVFHDPENVVNFRSPTMLQAGEQEREQFYERLARYGISEESLNSFKGKGFTDLTLGEAYNQYFISLIWDEGNNEFYGPESLCARTDCFTYPVIVPDENISTSVNIFDLQTGQCFNVPDSDEIRTAEVVPCNEEHDYEVIGLYRIQDSALPDAETLLLDCIPFFEPYVGIDYFDSRLDVNAIYPIQSSFEQGERTVSCYAFEMDGSALDRSVENASF